MTDMEERLKTQADAAEQRLVTLARQKGFMPETPAEDAQESDVGSGENQGPEEDARSDEALSAEPGRKAEAQDEDWQHRFQVLRGKYDAEVPRLSAELRETRRDNDVLRAQMDALRAEVANLKTTQEPPKAPEPEFDLAANLGLDDDSAQGMRRYIQSQIDKGVQAALAQINPKLESVTTTVQQSAAERFWSAVTAPEAVPDYWAIKDSPDLGQALARKAPMTSATYYQLLASAYEHLDAQAFIEVMRAVRPVESASAATQSPTEGKPSPEPSRSMSSKVVPRRAGGGGNPPAQPQILTRADIAALGSQALKLRIKGDWEGADQIERKIDAAVRERRVQ